MNVQIVLKDSLHSSTAIT